MWPFLYLIYNEWMQNGKIASDFTCQIKLKLVNQKHRFCEEIWLAEQDSSSDFSHLSSAFAALCVKEKVMMRLMMAVVKNWLLVDGACLFRLSVVE